MMQIFIERCDRETGRIVREVDERAYKMNILCFTAIAFVIGLACGCWTRDFQQKQHHHVQVLVDGQDYYDQEWPKQ